MPYLLGGGGGGGIGTVATIPSRPEFHYLNPENSLEMSGFNLYSVSFHVFRMLRSGNILEVILW